MGRSALPLVLATWSGANTRRTDLLAGIADCEDDFTRVANGHDAADCNAKASIGGDRNCEKGTGACCLFGGKMEAQLMLRASSIQSWAYSRPTPQHLCVQIDQIILIFAYVAWRHTAGACARYEGRNRPALQSTPRKLVET